MVIFFILVINILNLWELLLIYLDGKKDFVKMGSYGIGVSRLVGAIIEAKYDEKNEDHEMAN